jgi:hypothetical protein
MSSVAGFAVFVAVFVLELELVLVLALELFAALLLDCGQPLHRLYTAVLSSTDSASRAYIHCREFASVQVQNIKYNIPRHTYM